MTDERPEPSAPITPRRQASVTLRQQAGGDDAESQMFDPANQSAADALRISYRLLLLGIGVLVALFFISGFKTVDEGRVGIRLLAGEVKGRNLQPGMRWSWPQPLGEILTYHRNPQPIEIRDAFYPRGRARDPSESLEILAQTGSGSLDPRVDGSLITGDMNLAHAQWIVQYRRDDVNRFAERIYEDENNATERAIVRMAVQRGVVHAVSQASLDDVIKPGGQSSTLVSERARQYAQAMLDDIDSGLRIEVLDIQRSTVPLGIYLEWAKMAGEDAVAAQRIDEAQSEAQGILNKVAGAAAPYLIEQIDLYERAVELGDEAEQERVLATINSMIDGDPFMVDGEQVVVSGDVSRIMNMANQYRNSVAGREKTRLAKFRSIKEQFDSNPSVVVHREWSSAYREFRGKPFVQMIQVPPGTSLVELLVNEDPEIVREMQTALRTQRNQEAQDRRFELLNRQRLTPQVREILNAEPDN